MISRHKDLVYVKDCMKLSQALNGIQPSFCLRLPAQGIEELDCAPMKYSESTQIFLSHNSISTIENIEQFHFVTRLMLEFNYIRYIEDLQPLSTLPNLVELRLEGNPVCNLIFWDLHTIKHCSILRLLNGKPVNRDRIHEIETEDQLLSSIYFTRLSQNIERLLKRKKKISPHEKYLFIQKQIEKYPKKEFCHKIRSKVPRRRRKDYLHYLKETLLTKCEEAKAESLELQEMLQQMKEATDMEEFAANAQNYAGQSLRNIGLNTDTQVTTLAKNKVKTQRGEDSLTLKDGLVLSTRLTQKIEDEEVESYVYQPELEIESNTECNTYIPEDSLFQPEIDSEQLFAYEIMGTSTPLPTPQVSVTPQSSAREVILPKKLPLKNLIMPKLQIAKSDPPEDYVVEVMSGPTDEELERFTCDSTSSTDDDRRRGLSFDHQFQREIMDSSSQKFIDDNSEGSFGGSADDILKIPDPTFKTIPISEVPTSEILQFSSRSNSVKNSPRLIKSNEEDDASWEKKRTSMQSHSRNYLLLKYLRFWHQRYLEVSGNKPERNLVQSQSCVFNSPNRPPTATISKNSRKLIPVPTVAPKRKIQKKDLKRIVGNTIGSMLSESEQFVESEGYQMIRSTSDAES